MAVSPTQTGRPLHPMDRAMFFGTLISYLADRGFGFVGAGDSPDAGRGLFVHYSEFQKAGIRPEAGLPLRFDIAQREDGKLRAVNLHPGEAGGVGGREKV